MSGHIQHKAKVRLFVEDLAMVEGRRFPSAQAKTGAMGRAK